MTPEEFEKMRVGGKFEYHGVEYTVTQAEVYGEKAHSLTCEPTGGRVKIIDDSVLPYMYLLRYSAEEPEVT